ncbi:hypothetical protein WR25_07072 [Diploscapter pachys]|uniref:Secreted protein n=1 Tax=Diploscapter pachys TaxID=2018661 RepID=A0A2A2LMA0_9BILA|nr:hypothetical protein WR25_07072 [Diploscapter pachys]
MRRMSPWLLIGWLNVKMPLLTGTAFSPPSVDLTLTVIDSSPPAIRPDSAASTPTITTGRVFAGPMSWKRKWSVPFTFWTTRSFNSRITVICKDISLGIFFRLYFYLRTGPNADSADFCVRLEVGESEVEQGRVAHIQGQPTGHQRGIIGLEYHVVSKFKDNSEKNIVEHKIF